MFKLYFTYLLHIGTKVFIAKDDTNEVNLIGISDKTLQFNLSTLPLEPIDNNNNNNSNNLKKR